MMCRAKTTCYTNGGGLQMKYVIIWRPGQGGGFGFAASDPDVPGFRYSRPDKGIYVHCSELPEQCTRRRKPKCSRRSGLSEKSV